MFNLLISGRSVITHAAGQVISETQLAFAIPAYPLFSHLAVFRDPGVPIPDGYFAAVYVQMPRPTSVPLSSPPLSGQNQTQEQSEYLPLGYVSNEKQSAIFRLNLKAVLEPTTGNDTNKTKSENQGRYAATVEDDPMDEAGGVVEPDGSSGPTEGLMVMIGISLEPISNLAPLVESIKRANATKPIVPSNGGRETLVRKPQPGTASYYSATYSQNTKPTSTPSSRIPIPVSELPAETIKETGRLILKSAFDYLASFARPGSSIIDQTPSPYGPTGWSGSANSQPFGRTRSASSDTEETVPLRAIQDWWKKFEAKIDKDPSHLTRQSTD